MSRDVARELAEVFLAKGDSQGWFDALYQQARRDFSLIPWADREMNVHLRDWCERQHRPRAGEHVIVVGCGLGDDAEAMAARGAHVYAFDLSPEAIAWARERFPGSPVKYRAANLFEVTGAYDLVVESYTLQAMPLEMRQAAIAAVASLVAPGGEAVVICRGRSDDDPPGQLPWPLTPSDIAQFATHGLETVAFEDFDDPYEPGKRRFRYHGRRPA